MVLDKCENMNYHEIFIQDEESENIGRYFERCYRLISAVEKNNGTVFVHCRGGVSRSASIVVAYLMRSRKISMLEAQDQVFDERPIIEPNFGFQAIKKI